MIASKSSSVSADSSSSSTTDAAVLLLLLDDAAALLSADFWRGGKATRQHIMAASAASRGLTCFLEAFASLSLRCAFLRSSWSSIRLRSASSCSFRSISSVYTQQYRSSTLA